MDNGKKVVFWSGTKRWEPKGVDGVIATLNKENKIVSVEEITELPEDLQAFSMKKKDLQALKQRKGAWKTQWVNKEEVNHDNGN